MDMGKLMKITENKLTIIFNAQKFQLISWILIFFNSRAVFFVFTKSYGRLKIRLLIQWAMKDVWKSRYTAPVKLKYKRII
jgi:hypothetical protein